MELSLLDIILDVGVRCLVVVDHLHNLEEVLFLEFLKAISQFLHVELLIIGHVRRV